MMPAAASSGISMLVEIAARTASSFAVAQSSASVMAAAKSETRSGSESISSCVVMLVSRAQPGDRGLVRVHDEVAAAVHDPRHERVGNPGGVDVAGFELGLGVGEADLDELDRR